MKKIMVLTTVFCVIGASFAWARTSYWGSQEEQMRIAFTKTHRSQMNTVVQTAVDAVVSDPLWSGTRKQGHDIFRDSVAAQLGITPPSNWDSDVSDAQDAASDFERFLDSVIVNGNILTPQSKLDIITAVRALNLVFEPAE